MDNRTFFVLLGPDMAGKSSVMAAAARRLSGWRLVSTDDAFVTAEHDLITRLRRSVLSDVLPNLGKAYSVEFLASVLQTAVVHLRDQIVLRDRRTPLLMDSYYYKILAKCRLAGIPANPMYSWWRSFPQPQAVVYLDVSPESAWRRTRGRSQLNPLEHFGTSPEWCGFERYQRRLRTLMLEEVRRLPVTVIEEMPSASQATDAVLEVLTQ